MPLARDEVASVLRDGFLERPEPVGAYRRVRDERAIRELEDAERLPIELHEQRQPRPQLGQRSERHTPNKSKHAETRHL